MTEPDDLKHARSKLIRFLETSDNYDPKTFMPTINFIREELFEELAILYGKLEQHFNALKVYIHYLSGSFEQAEEYCEKYFNPDTEDGSGVYLDYLKVYYNERINVRHAYRSQATMYIMHLYEKSCYSKDLQC